MEKLHYEQSGDNYKLKDPYKLVAINIAKTTKDNIERFKAYGTELSEIVQSRGEPAYRIRVKSSKPLNFQLAHVEESIGTKNVIADDMAKIFGKTYYHSIAVDNVASIMNDLSTCGAFPVSFMLHLAAYPNEWYLEKEKIEALLHGTADACNISGAVWGGGESGTDKDIIVFGRSLLSGSATGIILDESKVLSEERLQENDRIILFESSGVHTNGITLLRKELLEKLPEGYKTKLSDGTFYGEALLTPSIIYSRLIEELINNCEIHYATHITGHGWRKIMRAKTPFTYTIESIPKPQPIFDFIKEKTNSADRDMYDTYNMGTGFAIFVPESSVKKVLEISKELNIRAWDSGFIKKGDKRVVISSLNLIFTEKDMIIR